MMKITYAGGNGAGDARHLAVQAFSSTEILTAMQNGSGNLELIGWVYKDGVRRGVRLLPRAQAMKLRLR